MSSKKKTLGLALAFVVTALLLPGLQPGFEAAVQTPTSAGNCLPPGQRAELQILKAQLENLRYQTFNSLQFEIARNEALWQAYLQCTTQACEDAIYAQITASNILLGHLQSAVDDIDTNIISVDTLLGWPDCGD